MQRISLRKTLTLLCPALSCLFLGIGYRQDGLVVGIFAFLVWLAVRRWAGTWGSGLALAVTTFAAVFGIANGGAFAWMILSATLGLASWDLILFNWSLAGQTRATQVSRLEKTHDLHLAVALLSGLLVAFIGRAIQFQIPFLLMLLMVVLAFFCLDRLFHALAKP